MSDILLLATDLDGTLVGNGERPEQYRAFRDIVYRLRRTLGSKWAIVTGRHERSMRRALNQLSIHGLIPDFLVLEDARIFRRRSSGRYSSFFWWNFSVDRRRRRLRKRYYPQIRTWRRELTARFPETDDLSVAGSDLWLRFPHEEAVGMAVAFLREQTDGDSCLEVFHWGTEVYLAPMAGCKGDAVERICRRLKVPPACAFAVGDGANDVSMLNGAVVGMPACVGNAIPEVREAVRLAEGYEASGSGLTGVLEALERYLPDALR
mgnify:CR=1 FL=1